MVYKLFLSSILRAARLSVVVVLGLTVMMSAVVSVCANPPTNVFNLGGTQNPTTGQWTGLASLQFVTVGNPGNVPDTTVMVDGTTGYGSVPYVYGMGKYDTTVAQYVQFLNSVATQSDPYGLYNSDMALGESFPTVGISQTLVSGTYSYAVTGTAPSAGNMPVFAVTWGDAARFCNWLQNGQPTGGTEAANTTETGAYALNGATTDAQLMGVPSPAHSGSNAATYFLPTENEWYKAAYYSGDGTNSSYWAYPTKSNTAPINILSPTGTNNANFWDEYDTGNGGDTDPTNYLTPVGSFVLSPGPYGTYDMGGDVWQWNETDISASFRGGRGGSLNDNSTHLASSTRDIGYPTTENYGLGFRVASSVVVPEPDSLALLLAVPWRLESGEIRNRFFEWYKAAYYVGGGTNAGYWTYPTQSNIAPNNSLVLATSTSNEANCLYNGGDSDPMNYLTAVGTFSASPGPYGTYDMGGDLQQWNETAVNSSSRGRRGGFWDNNATSMASSIRDSNDPAIEDDTIGFRVASSVAVPEPGSISLLLACAVVFGIWRLRRKA